MARYAIDQQHPVLFVEMRLGKTLVTLRVCSLYRPRNRVLGLRVLVAAPNSALGGWETEALGEGWRVVWLLGDKKKRSQALQGVFGGVRVGLGGKSSATDSPRSLAGIKTLVLINREGWLALPQVASGAWDAVIADESPFLKNPKAGVTKFFLRNFRTVPHRWILTGTPCPEGEHEYFCQLAFCRGGAFGFRRYWDFRASYMEPSPWGKGWELKPGAADHLRRVVGESCCVMRRKDVRMEKDKIMEQRVLEFSGEARKMYDKIEAEMAIGTRTTKWITTTWSWLRQLCGGFVNGNLIWDGKIKEVVELLTGELREERAVVWCSFNHEIREITNRLNKRKVCAVSMTGADSMPIRRQKEKWFREKVRVLVVQQAVAQTGMDLSAADTAIYYSTPVGQLARAQTEDRILSLAKETPLLYLDLIVKDSVDVDIAEALARKIKLSDLSLTRALAAVIRKRKGWICV